MVRPVHDLDPNVRDEKSILDAASGRFSEPVLHGGNESVGNGARRHLVADHHARPWWARRDTDLHVAVLTEAGRVSDVASIAVGRPLRAHASAAEQWAEPACGRFVERHDQTIVVLEKVGRLRTIDEIRGPRLRLAGK